ncbi:MAG: hypothetical protein P8R54_07370 [Myxococcota bacterium]|nr:hypothetical protein [Myxococcota bacterium]
MSEAEKTIIWFDRKREHFYAVPEGTELEEGELKLHNLRGQMWRVNPDDIATWALSREAATERVGARIDAAWGDLRGAWSKLLDVGQKTAGSAGVDISGEVRPELPEDLAGVLGMAPGELLTEPGLIRNKIRKAMFGEAFEDGTDPLAADASSAEASDASSAEGAADAEPQAEASLEDFAKKAEETMRGVFKSPEFGAAMAGFGTMLRRAGQKLQEAAEGLEE